MVLRGNDGAPWAVRELYYSCDEKKPRLYDRRACRSFLLGTDDAENGWVSIVLLPPAPSSALWRSARPTSAEARLGVLGSSYSANAYPFSTQFQNCNQWVIELLADAWADTAMESAGDDADGDGDPAHSRGDQDEARTRAQRWLYGRGSTCRPCSPSASIR